MSSEVFPTYEDDSDQLPLVTEERLKLDLPIGALTKALALTLPEVGPLTGIEYETPLVLYQLAYTIGDCTKPPSILPYTEKNFFLFEYPILVRMS